MIIGEFRDGFPRIRLTLGENADEEVEFVADTGFAGEITLSFAVLQRVRAQRIGKEPMRLADGTARLYQLYEVIAEIDGENRFVEAVEMEGDPLLGIALMREQQLNVEVTEGGEVLLEKF